MEPINISQGLEIGQRRRADLKVALALGLITVFYNVAEGLVSVYFGIEDETLALFGFGLDSFVEVISGIGIVHMLLRMRGSGSANTPDKFEATALRVTGGAFYLLGASMLLTAGLTIYEGHRPESTFWGVVVSLVSICTMWLLIYFKVKVGTRLRSDAILADAACTRACLYLSIVLLVASAGYELTGLGWLDAAGVAGIAIFAFKEGHEAFGKAAGKACGCAGGCKGA